MDSYLSFKIILRNRSQRIYSLPSDIYMQFSYSFELHYPKK